MGARRTFWHIVFTRLLTERRPPWIKVVPELSLSEEAQRVDDLLELDAEVSDRSDPGLTLRGLWPHIRKVALLEYKSPTRDFRAGDLARLMGYGFQFFAPRQQPAERRLRADELTLVRATPTINAALVSELDELSLGLQPLGGGYFQATTSPLRLLVIDLTAVAESEDDDFLRWFGRNALRTIAVLRWAQQNAATRENTMDPQLEEDFDEFARKVMASYPVEKRLEGIAPEQLVLALPDAALAGLSEDYRRTLPTDVQEKIRARLASR